MNHNNNGCILLLEEMFNFIYLLPYYIFVIFN